MPTAPPRKRPQKWRPRRDWGRLFAFVLCVLFAIVGAVPLALGFLVRTGPVRAWAARKTATLLASELGLNAHYQVSVQAWPMLIALDDLVIEASDGGTPFLQVERAAIRPRPFSLLAGELDVGDVEIIGPRIRAVVEHGELVNLHYRIPGDGSASTAPSTGPTRPPLASISITDARIDAIVDDLHVDTKEVDLDVSVEDPGAFEIAIRAGTTQVTRTYKFPGREAWEDAVDDDVICRLDARVRVQGTSVVVRRLLLQGSADFDPDPGTTPSCHLAESDPRAVEVRLGAVHLELPKGGPIQARGRVHAKVPASIAHRFVTMPHATGSLTLDLEADFDGVAKLPILTGHISGDRVGADGKVFSKHLDLDLATTASGTVLVSKMVALWADGKVTIPEVKLEPFAKGVPLTVGPVILEGLEFPALLRDLGVHPQAYVSWSFDHGRFEHLKGTLDPLLLEGPLSVSTHGFEIFDHPVSDPRRLHRMGVKEAVIHGDFIVNGLERSSQYKMPGVVFSNFAIDTPKSHVHTNVTLGFATLLDIELFEDTKIDVSEISPLIDIPVAGVASLKATGRGPFTHPKFTGDLAIKDFVFAGMPVGDLESSHVAFEPLVLDLIDAHIKHGGSRMRSALTRIAFDKGPDVLIDGDLDTRDAPHVRVRDLFEIFHFDKDPRFADIDAVASGKARFHYVLGGKDDRCGGGQLDIHTTMDVSAVSMFGERWDDGVAAIDLSWDDQAAGSSGMRIDVRSATLRKGSGSVLATATVRHGGVVQGTVIGSGIPISKLDVFGASGKLFDGSISLVANLGGTLSDFETVADIDVSRLRIGPASLPPSHLRVAMTGTGKPAGVVNRTRCGNERGAPFDLAEYERDVSGGYFKINGSLFEGQVALDDVRITRQKRMMLDGRVRVTELDLGTLSNLIPGVAFASASPEGKLTASLDVKSLPLGAPQRGEMTLAIQRFEIARDGSSVALAAPSGPIVLAGDELDVPELRVTAKARAGLSATFVTGGKIHRVTTSPDVDIVARVEPINLARLSEGIAGVERAAGTVDANLRIMGSPSALRYSGAGHLRKGDLNLKGVPLAIQDIDIDLDIAGGDARIKRATARVGGGTVEVSGRMPLRGPDAGAVSGTITARGVKVPAAEGVTFTADADLEATYKPTPSSAGAARSLPDVKGNVSLTSFSYTKPMALNPSSLARPPRSAVNTYDPADDVVKFEITLVSPRPLRFTNNLIDMELAVADPGIVLSGTNQRFGARGLLRILPDSKLQLRNNEFLVREGSVRFDDPLKIAPQVDVRAQTEYRRYASAAAEQSVSGTGTDSSGGASSGSTQSGSGIWRITLNVHGDADDLKMTLASDPPLRQEDIVLLLTIGMTRAEIDRGEAVSSLGETVGLEALSALTGADKAVKKIVPLIDEFHFGTGYSSKTGRTEPTVTVGKRITDNVRATVTTGITENREVRSNVEWRLNRKMSVQGSYDNVNDVSSSTFGNVGADFRLRLEFE
jgi:translocation and assembly module TamB